MKPPPSRGAWSVRALIHCFTVLLGLLVFWLLGFLVRDIESLRGPDFELIQGRHLDRSLVEQREALGKRIADLDRTIANKREEQRLAGESSQSLQRTISQLVELQRLSMQKEIAVSEAERANFTASLNRFLESQKSYEELNQEIIRLTAQKQVQVDERRLLEQGIEEKLAPARTEYGLAMQAHRLRLAIWQLVVLVPLLLLAGFLLVRQRGSAYFPLHLAFGGATLVKSGLVIHKYFPSRYLKYVLVAGVLAVVIRLLVHLIRSMAFPKAEALLKQYREAYERFLCPVCDYPVRVGPRRFLFWTRRTVHKVLPPGTDSMAPGPYACPSCGTTLFEACAKCGKVRHALLPHCEHCGAAKAPMER